MLRTKFHRPSISNDLIHRPRLLKLFENNSQKPLVLVCAPAGYGKSIIVSQWLEQQTRKFSWLSLDEHQNDLSSFLEHFVEALSSLILDGLSESQKFIYDPAFLSKQVFRETLLNEVSEIGEPLILVLDDYHVINNATIHELVESLIEYPPPNLQLVLISRRDPPFGLQKLRLHGQLLDVRMRDLALDEDELKELSMRQGIPDNSKNLKELMAWTEGWILGARLYFSESPPLVNELAKVKSSLLFHEVELYFENLLKSFNAEMQLLISAVALSERFNAELVDVLAQSENIKTIHGKEFVKLLQKNQFFLVQLDDKAGWCRFHHLFRDWLNRHFLKTNAVRVKEIQSIISVWFEGEGLFDEGIQHAVQAGDFDLATNIISRHRWEMLDRDRFWVVQRWLSMIPEPIRNSKAELLLAQLGITEHTWLRVDVPSIVAVLDDLMAADTDPKRLAEFLFHKGHYLVFSLQDGNKARALLERSKNLFADQSMFGAHRELSLALARHMAGRTDEALAELDHITEKHQIGSLMHIRSYLPRVFILLLTAKFSKARSVSEKFAFLATNCGWETTEAFSWYCQANASFQQFSKSNAHISFKTTTSFYGKSNYRIHFDAMAGWILYQSMEGDLEGAKASLRSMEMLVNQLKDDAVREYFLSARARLQWQQGEAHQSLNWAAKNSDSISPDTYFFLIDVPVLTRYRVLLTHGSSAQVRQVLKQIDAIRHKMQAIHNHYCTVDMLIMEALGEYRLNNLESAADLMGQAVEQAHHLQNKRPLIEIRMAMPELIELVNKPTDLTATKISSSLHSLTLREQEIATKISEGLRNKEIADQLNISVITVKSHLSNIYRKLEVPNRTTMVRKVKELHLIG